MTEKEVLEQAFRALDGLAARPVRSQSEAKIPESYTSRRCTSETLTDPSQAQIDQAGRILAPEASAPSLKGSAAELWRDGRRFFLVADDEDALEAMRRFGAHRGEVWTGAELELVATIPDQATRGEVESFKRQMDGCLSMGVAGKFVSAAEWQAQMLNQMSQEQGVTGQPAKIKPETVQHGLKGKLR